MHKKYLTTMTATILFIIGITIIVYEPVLLGIGDLLIVEDELHPVDVIHVISGEDYRQEHGIQLYKQGYSKYLFFTGGWCAYHNVNHAQHGREMALSEGVPDGIIFTDEAEIDSTYAEAMRLKEWIDGRIKPITSIMVVSDGYHTRRARWAYKRILGDSFEIIMAPVPFDLSSHQRLWWRDRESQNMVKGEYLKLAFYLARYQFSWGIFREWLAAYDRY